MFDKVLVANRGEIAIRVMRTLEEMGIASIAVYSELDRDALHVKRADEAYLLGPGPAPESYLRIDKLIAVAKQAGAQAVHPGYGFLAENAAFARACDEAGIVFIGPPADAVEAMGSKTRARELMRHAGVPIVPGTTEPVESIQDARGVIEADIGYPVAIKAAGGGGGKGFRVALEDSELESAFEGAAREGEKFFGDPTVYLERYLPDPRHVEVQVLADRHGNVIHLGERDCSVQRRHQKLIEESPAPAVDEELRERIGEIATDAARAVDYVGAGTVEGLLADGDYFFLEMNTRVQVEHCVTEMTTGIDIVREGIRAAAGEALTVGQEDIVLSGHAIECRINAEDAAKNFAPAPGRIESYLEPAGPARVRDRGPDHADSLPQGAPDHRPVGARRDLPRPRRRPQLAQGARPAQAEAQGRRAASRERRAGLHGGGLGPAVRRQGHRPAAGRQRLRTGPGGRPGGAQAGPARSARGRRRRRRREHPLLAAAGHGAAGGGREGGDGGGGRPHRRDRGDEDGERDHRAQGGEGDRSAHRRRRLGRLRRHPRGHRVRLGWARRRRTPAERRRPAPGRRSAAPPPFADVRAVDPVGRLRRPSGRPCLRPLGFIPCPPAPGSPRSTRPSRSPGCSSRSATGWARTGRRRTRSWPASNA